MKILREAPSIYSVKLGLLLAFFFFFLQCNLWYWHVVCLMFYGVILSFQFAWIRRVMCIVLFVRQQLDAAAFYFCCSAGSVCMLLQNLGIGV